MVSVLVFSNFGDWFQRSGPLGEGYVDPDGQTAASARAGMTGFRCCSLAQGGWVLTQKSTSDPRFLNLESRPWL